MNFQNERMSIIYESQKIYLDTSAAMHHIGFQKFVDQMKDGLKEREIKIHILKVVWLELIRNYNSADKTKAESANYAIGIISNNREIFEIEDEQVFQYEMEQAFADKVLLSNIILERTDSSILLITNDKMLSSDALKINHQASCRGYKISTCYIANNGKLLPGFSNHKNEIESEEIISEVKKNIEIPMEQKKQSWFFSIMLSASTLLTGIVIGKYGETIINTVKKRA